MFTMGMTAPEKSSKISAAAEPFAQGGQNMREIGHFIGGKEVKGASGRFGDVFNPNTGEVAAKVALAGKSEVEKAIANARGRISRLGRDQSAASRPSHVQILGTDPEPI